LLFFFLFLSTNLSKSVAPDILEIPDLLESSSASLPGFTKESWPLEIQLSNYLSLTDVKLSLASTNFETYSSIQLPS
jgi:hypothetical protein